MKIRLDFIDNNVVIVDEDNDTKVIDHTNTWEEIGNTSYTFDKGCLYIPITHANAMLKHFDTEPLYW